MTFERIIGAVGAAAIIGFCITCGTYLNKVNTNTKGIEEITAKIEKYMVDTSAENQSILLGINNIQNSLKLMDMKKADAEKVEGIKKEIIQIKSILNYKGNEEDNGF